MNNANLIPGLLAILITSTLPCGLFAQAGSLDSDFDADGKVATDLGSDFDAAYSVAIQPDGRIVAAGYSYNGADYDFAVVRYHPDGTLDNSFSMDGMATTDMGAESNQAYSVAIQPDGRIVTAGNSGSFVDTDFAVVRYNADGTLDSSFSMDGTVTTDIGTSLDEAYSVAIQPDGRIVAAGYSYDGADYDFAVVRYQADGSLDTSFSMDGMVTTAIGTGADKAYSAAIQPDGRIVVAGYSNNGAVVYFALVRYNVDGTLDNSFSIDGKVTTAIGAVGDVAYSVAIQPDGRIVAAGNSNNGTDDDFAVVRYNVDGTLDNSFSIDGKVTTAIGANEDVGRSVAIQTDGRIVAAGNSNNGTDYDFAVVRYNADGTLDNSFSVDGKATTAIGGYHDRSSSVAIQPDERIVAVGSSVNGVDEDFAVVRYISGLNVGVVEFSGPGTSTLIYPNPLDNNATLQYVLSKEDRISIQLLDAEGSVLHTFIENQLQGTGEHQQAIAMPGLPSGSYVIVLSSPAGKVSIRVVK